MMALLTAGALTVALLTSAVASGDFPGPASEVDGAAIRYIADKLREISSRTCRSPVAVRGLAGGGYRVDCGEIEGVYVVPPQVDGGTAVSCRDTVRMVRGC